MESTLTHPPLDDLVRAPARAPTVPPPPETLEETGLPEEFVAGLALKGLYVRGATLGFELADLLALPMAILDGVIERLQESRLVEVHSTRGPTRGEYLFRLTTAGRGRAAEELEMSRYVGPAPVPFDAYLRWVERQAVGRVTVSQAELRGALDGAVLPEATLELLGPAINSGSSLFLYGAPGNGKTLVAERMARLFGERYYVPYAVLVDGMVMIVHDPVHHGAEAPALDPEPEDSHAVPGLVRRLPDHDPRFAAARRPVVVTGGELTLDQLDLQWDPAGRMYQAPPQLKATGGVLLVDDLGRQRTPVRDLLNRWVVPLEQRQDYLTLRSGRKVVVPFDCFVIFSTNLEPRSLADEAFLRRIHYKIEVPNPDRGEYERIFRACCAERDIAYHRDALDYLYDGFYAGAGIEPRRCHPRDVLDHLRDLAGYLGEDPCLSPRLLERACQSYFLTPG